LDIFWIKTHCSKKWKLLVFNAVITSKVLYGLETLEPTEAAGRLLNTFQLKGLRKILKLHTTFVQRNNSDEYVYNIEEPMILSTRRQKDLGDKSNQTTNRNSGRQKTETSWACLEEGIGNIHCHYTKLRSPQDPRSHGKPNTEDEAAHNNSGHLTI
jgi:hypothetical protein